MAITDIANVDISLQTTGVTRQSFGIPLFVDAHRYFEERIRSYTSLTQVGQDFPTTSDSYKAAQQFFSNTPAPRTIKLGRREATAVVTPASVAEGKIFSVTVATGSNSVTASYTAVALDTATQVVTGLKSAIDAATAVAAKVDTTIVGNTLTLEPATAGDLFSVKAVTNTSLTFTTTEVPSTTIQAIAEVDNEFYFVTAHDKSATFSLQMAAEIEARTKLYFVSSSAPENYAAVVDPVNAADVLGLLKAGGYARSVGMYAHNAADHPECAYVGYNAPFAAGSVVWTNLVVAIPVALNASGAKLTATQQNNIEARNGTFVRLEGGVNAIRGGKVASGEWIDNIRGRDNLQSDMKASLSNLLLSQQGGKLKYDNSGLNAVRSVMAGDLDAYVARGFIQPNYVISIPDATAISASKKQTRLLDDATFKAELSGAIVLIEINGTLQLEI